MVIFVILSFAYFKINIWLDGQADIIISSTQRKFYDNSYVFNFEKGFNLAVAFTAYDNVVEDILDPSYGRIVFTTNDWGMDQND